MWTVSVGQGRSERTSSMDILVGGHIVVEDPLIIDLNRLLS